MLFRRRKGMIDMRELQKRGVVVIPKKDSLTPTNQEGFIEIGKSKNTQLQSSSSSQNETLSNKDFFGFQNLSNPSTSETSSTSQFSTQTDGYDKREVDEKITGLDNKIYKLENRLEVLEKKLDINQTADTNVGVMGW
jgi:hypothetical protein